MFLGLGIGLFAAFIFCHCRSTNRQLANTRKHFRFEDYDGGEQASVALTKAFPRGTLWSSLHQCMLEAGAKCNEVRPGLFSCEYNQSSRSLVHVTWSVAVEIDVNERVQSISVRTYLTGP